MRTRDTLAVTVTVRNHGAEPATFAFNTTCFFLYGVANARGDHVHPGPRLCGGGVTVDVPAGDELSATFRWDGRADDGNGGSQRLRPGIYHVWGAFHVTTPTVPLELRR